MATQPTSSAPNAPKNFPNPFAARRYGELHRVTDRVYIVRNITNSSFVIGDRSVAVIDTQVNHPSAVELLRLIRSVTDKPIEYVINTHYHWDHTNGNAVFKNEGATIVSSALTKEFMTVRAPRQKEFLSGRGFELGEDPALPDVTFQDELALNLGGLRLRLFFAGCAESDDATAIEVPSEKVVMAGDTVMTGSFPIFGQPVWDEGLQGDGEWQRAIQRLMSLGPKKVIPGHGPLAEKKEVETLLEIENFFCEEVSKLVSRGHSVREVIDELEPRLPEWMVQMPVVWGTPRYAILRVFRGLTKKQSDKIPGWQRFKPSAIPSPKKTSTVEERGSLSEYAEMARQAREGGDPGLELAVYKKAAERFGSDPDAQALYADALIDASKMAESVLEKGDFFDAARSAWQRALDLDPNHLHTLLGKGRYLTMMAFRGGDDPARGMAILKKIVDRKPGGAMEAQAEFYLGMGYRRLGDEVQAELRYDNAIRLDPTWAPPHLAKKAGKHA